MLREVVSSGGEKFTISKKYKYILVLKNVTSVCLCIFRAWNDHLAKSSKFLLSQKIVSLCVGLVSILNK